MMKAIVILALFGYASAGNLGGYGYGGGVHGGVGYAAHAHINAAHHADGVAYINGAVHSLAVHAENHAARDAHNLHAQIATQNAINHDGAVRNAAAAGAIQNYAAARDAHIQAGQFALQRGITLAGPAIGYGAGVGGGYGGFGGYGAGVYGKVH